MEHGSAKGQESTQEQVGVQSEDRRKYLTSKVQGQIDCERFQSEKGIDYNEIFSPVVKMSSIRVVLGMAATMDLEIEQLDVKTAFLHDELEDEIYMEMEQPKGFMVAGKEHLVCNKSLCGLKQTPRQWYKKFEFFYD